MIQLAFAAVEYHPHGCTSRFLDGSSVDAIPHPWDHCYSIIAMRCGYGFDLWKYCVHHEICHHIIEEWMHNRPSQVLWALAHGETPDPKQAFYEENATQTLQRWIMTNERPIIGGIDWNAIRDYTLERLNDICRR